ncbi:MAG TPA: hypothetical protein VEY51_15685, partial [Chondromyces sp.]|nr:hypothetical protein [Chondromyces sp.]
MNLTKWSYTRRYNIKAYFDKFPHSNVVFRPINYFYFVYIVNWSKEDPVVTRADLEEMEKLLNKELGTGNAYAQRKSQTESISLNESAKGVVLKRAMVIANPSSGRERAEQYINEINRQLTEVYDE